MRISWLRLLIFVAAGALAIGLVWWTDRPKHDTAVMDRHTGRVIQAPQAPALNAPRKPLPAIEASPQAPPPPVLEAAMRTGDAAKALRLLERERDSLTPLEAEACDRVSQFLRAELASVQERPPGTGPPWPGGEPAEDPLELARFLAAAEGGEVDGRAVERFFQPLVSEHLISLGDLRNAVESYWPPDQVAAMAIELAGGTLERVDEEICLLVARSFRSAARHRGRMRWLIRAYARVYTHPRVVEELSGAYVEMGRPQEGFAVVGAALAAGLDDPQMLRLRIQMSQWAGELGAEIEATRRLLEHGEDPELRRRLVHLYAYSGRPQLAVEHAEWLARQSGAAADFELAANLALSAGLVDEGFRLLRLAADHSTDRRPWIERIVHTAQEDLRYDEAVRAVEELFAEYGGERYERMLEAMYRQRRIDDKLVELLDRRLARSFDPELEDEVLGLHFVLGNDARVREIAADRLRRAPDPQSLFEQYLLCLHAGVENADELLRERIAEIEFSDEDVETLLWLLSTHFGNPAVRDAFDRVVDSLEPPERAFAIRVRLVDLDATPQVAVERAEELARRYPERVDVLRLLIARISWTDDPEREVKARERLAQLEPDDADNRLILAELHEGTGRLAESEVHWRWLAERDGPGSIAAARLIEVLFGQSKIEEATAWLEKQAGVGAFGDEDRRKLAEQFFSADRPDRALSIYEQILATNPDDAEALLRVGQIRSWSNDPGGALPFLERHLAIAGPGDGEVLYLIGEVHFAQNQEHLGLELHERALPLLRARENPDVVSESQVAKILARIGHVDQARAIFQRLVAENPKNHQLELDFSATMVAAHDLATAREALERARPHLAKHKRFLRLEGILLMEEGRWEEAIPVLTARLELHGPDAGTLSDLGRAYERIGRFRSSVEAFDRSLTLQPDNRDVADARTALRDRVASVAEFEIRTETLGDDEVLETEVSASVLAQDELTRYAVQMFTGSYSGRAAAVDQGRSDVTDDLATMAFSMSRQLDADRIVGGGIMTHAGREDGAVAGMWVGGRWQVFEPFQFVNARLYLGDVLRRPAAAAALGGSATGIRAEGLRDFDEHWYGSALLSLENLEITTPDDGEISGGRLFAQIVGGYRFQAEAPRVIDAVHPQDLPLVDMGSTVRGEREESLDTQYVVWGTLSTVSVDSALSEAVPLGEQFNYLILSGLAKRTLTPGLTAEAEGFVGTNLDEGDSFAGLRVGASWRKSEDLEFRLGFSAGQALGRVDQGDTQFTFELGVSVRW